MFTGIITEIGKIESIVKVGEGIKLRISAPRSTKELNVNDSISINGACQTVVLKSKNYFEVAAVEETLKKTTFGSYKMGDLVNLELAMKLNDRLGGHLVSGHVDCVGIITSIEPRTISWIFNIKIPEKYSKYIIRVGSIAIDGVSLTIADLKDNLFKVSIIPHTMENTIFKLKKVNDKVNLEFDLVGKYIENIIKHSKTEMNQLTINKLKELGY